MNGAFTGQILAEKLNKLNSSRQSIETLSHWCIFHRKKAKQVVQTWERAFHDAPREQRVPFLYLANDILQNSRRKGGEFVTEFWKVLSGALRDVMEHGDDSGRAAVYRLVDIWEERRVFGSRGSSLREELLFKAPLSPVHDNVTVEREKPPASPPKVGPVGFLEKFAAAYQAVQDGQTEEDEALQNCNYAISHVESLEKEAESRNSAGGVQDSIADELQEQQAVLGHCIEQLESSEMTRATLVSQLKEVLHEQESKLEHLRTQLQIAQAQAEQAGSVRQRLLTGSPSLSDLSPVGRENGGSTRDASLNHHPDGSSVLSDKDNNNSRMNVTGSQQPSSGSMGMERTAPLDDDSKKQNNGNAAAAAAEVAAKLAANTSSAAMLTSVLSSLAAEEARTPASMALDVPNLGRPLDKRQRIDVRPDGSDQVQSYAMAPQPSHQQQTHQHQLPQPPPMGQYMQQPMMSMQYAYGGPLPPPPPMQGHPMMQLARMGGPPQPLPPGCGTQQPPYQPLQPPNMGYYSSPPLPAPPAPIRPQ
ncbi:regulator of Ty1 transposition protein 103 [Marchantia polymorpha subsp. ruderalis]|uniref:CID domain-containing protein n=2 Tax=Marchantia polymorpha TaxID=3197 RepID=A0AAF6BQ93_MARPO|nr:hypothetical protein MARPO_0152s0004 [Marchantia polymorpha]BBN14177.1 hypothetical protein Mp_6g09520 [Marchantia polymorpha subsp. ruderalis]|eukprot:PTQ28886.1 hypothetical protein MARPO_0152s0004 [Marchantia polymorpha]